MSYSPLNATVFAQAYAAAFSAMVLANRKIVNATTARYDPTAAIAGAWAQAFDTAWGANPANTLQIQMIADESYAAFEGRAPSVNNANTAAAYTKEATAIITSITSASNYFSANGIPIPFATSGGTATVVFQPGGTAGPGTYTTWNALWTDWASFTGPLQILFDTTHSAGATTLPTGGWVFASSYFTWKGLNKVSNITLAVGFICSNVSQFSGNLVILGLNNVTTAGHFAIQSGSGTVTVTVRDTVQLVPIDVGPLISYPTGSGSDGLIIYEFDNCLCQQGGGGLSVFRISGSGFISLRGLAQPIDTGTIPTDYNNVIGAPTAAQVFNYTGPGNQYSGVQQGILDTQIMPVPLGLIGQATRNSGPEATALTDGNATIGIANGFWHILSVNLTANRTITLSPTGAVPGDQLTFTQKTNAAFTMTYVNGGGLGGTLVVAPSLKEFTAVFQCIDKAGNWEVRSFGSI